MVLAKKNKKRLKVVVAISPKQSLRDATGQAGGFHNRKKVVVAMSPKENLRFPTGQAGGFRRRKKVAVAMSGGVDSSVAAALLKKEGYNVIGVFMKFWKPRINADNNTDLRGFENRCCALESERRARKVAKILNIPFYVFNFEKEFKKKVVDYFLAEHKKGITPNPCVICNKEIKFGLLLEKALKLDADFVATGHYVRLRSSDSNLPARYSPALEALVGGRITSELSEYSEHSDENSEHSDRVLLKAKDKNKDQSYFLWQLNQKQLKRVLFPVGDYTRKEVESLAKKFKLPFSGVKKSQEICFIPKTGEEASPLLRPFVKTRAVEDFLKRYLKSKNGKIITKDRKVIGGHQGLWLYTIGQRKGIKLPGGPYYVLDKDLKNNLLIVTKREKDLFKKELIVKNVNWILGKEFALPIKIKAKIRYRQQPATGTITKKLKAKTYELKFIRPQRAITPGQSAVFYGKGGELLGGGIIC